jgi:hypothetical protein
VIGKVVRGSHVGGLLRYLFGPGRANEHTDPHLVATWADAPSVLEPRSSFSRLTGFLEQPLNASARPVRKTVWHASLRVAPGDRRLSDEEWATVAQEVVHRTGFAPKGDDDGCRWIAVRHADDHIHLVVTLARQDGRRVSTSNDFHRLGDACRWAEEHLGLTVTPGRDRTATKRATRAETEKAARGGRWEAPRIRLQREVRTAAAAASDQSGFLQRLKSAGVLVRPRYSQRNPGEITGYSVALPGDHSSVGEPVWYGGGKLASDLTWTKLARRWTPQAPSSSASHERLSGAARTAAWARAHRITAQATKLLGQLATSNPNAAADIAHSTADALNVTARVVEGRKGGPLTEAATAYDRAGRELWGRTAVRTSTGDGMRAAARILSFAGRAHRGESAQFLHLVTQLIALTEAVAQMRDAQGRAAQAEAARRAAHHLRHVAPSRGLDGAPNRQRPKHPLGAQQAAATRSER